MKCTYRIHHKYDRLLVLPAFVVGCRNPAGLLAYLQFRAERELSPVDCLITNRGAACLLTQFYGYEESVSINEYYVDVDLYELRESRCGQNWKNWIARCWYWRRGLSQKLLSCVEQY